VRVTGWFALCLGVSLAPSGPVQAQAAATDQVCEQGRISNIFIDNHDIFAIDEAEQGKAVRMAYGVANALHIRTTKRFIRRELLFEVGDCLDPVRLEESGRILRQYGFISRADVFAVVQPDGDYHVVIDTQDEWTTKVDLGVSFDDGLQLEVLDVTEENLLGQGILAGAFIRRRRERRDAGLLLELPHLFGSRTDATFGLGRTRNGNFFQQTIEYPFVGEVGQFALREVFVRRDELFAFATGGSEDFSHALLPYVNERAEFSVAGRLGEPGNLTLFGIGVSRETVEFGGFPGDVQIAIDNNFGEAIAAPAAVTDVVLPQTSARSTSRLSLMLGQRNLRFLRARGLDNLRGIQDIELGTDIGLTVGRSVSVLSRAGIPSTSDMHTRLRAFAGHDPGASFLFAKVALEGRRLFDQAEPGGPWRDVLAEGDFFAYLRSAPDARNALFLRVSAAGGWSTVTPFQLTLGGRASVRGFREENLPGAQRVIVTIEDRLFLGWPKPNLMDVGLTLFADAGQVWAGDTPYGTDSGWKGTVGFGLRLGLPAGSRGVTRLDLAFPVGGGGGGPVFRVTALELVGIFRGFEDPQMLRSRRVNLGPDQFVTDNR
jgi:hypothetical protein